MARQQTTRRRRLMGEINVVPYIDVMLVLLIIFMITAPLLTQGIKVDLPKAGARAARRARRQQPEPLMLSVDARGRLFLNVGANPQRPLDDADGCWRARRRCLRRAPERGCWSRAIRRGLRARRRGDGDAAAGGRDARSAS